MQGASLVLLPGMDGTGLLFQPLLKAAPPSFNCVPIRFPDAKLTYAELEHLAITHLPEGPLCLVAESFSGPLGLRLAARLKERVRGVALCNSFIGPPCPRWVKRLPSEIAFMMRCPRWAAERWLLGPKCTDELLALLHRALQQVSAATLSFRLRQVLELHSMTSPVTEATRMLYLRGDHDRLVPERCVEEVQRRFPGVFCERLPGPHLLLQTHPEQCWRALLKFFEVPTP